MKDTPMMKCGHAANAVNQTGAPSCVICVGIHPGAEIVDEDPAPLEGRMARCDYYGKRGYDRGHWSCNYGQKFGVCTCEQPSSSNLPFFEAKPDKPYDSFYCGCHGWD